MSEEKLYHSMPFDGIRVRQIVAEVDAEISAEAAPFEEVMPAEIADARRFKVGDVLTITSRNHPSCGRQARILEITSGILPLHCAVLDYAGSRYCVAADKNLTRDTVIYTTNLCADDFALVSATKSVVAVHSPKDSILIQKEGFSVNAKTSIVVGLGYFFGAVIGGFIGLKYYPTDTLYFGDYVAKIVIGSFPGMIFIGIPLAFLIGGVCIFLEKRGINPFALIEKATGAITNTVLGLWAAIKGTAYGIGYTFYGIGVGLYYAITNQLMLSVSRTYNQQVSDYVGRADWEDDIRPALATTLPHFLGVAASIAAVCKTVGVPIWDKLIFGWWAFYVLNIFYLIGTNVRDSKNTS